MKVPDGTGFKMQAKVEVACGKEARSPALHDAHLDIGPDGNGTLYASDSVIAVRIPVKVGASDTPGAVPSAALKAARAKDCYDHEIELTDKARVSSGSTITEYFRSDAAFPPSIETAFRAAADDDIVIGIAPARLLQAAQAMGAGIVELRIRVVDGKPDTLAPFRVEVSGTDAVAMVMPCRPAAR